MSFYRTAIIAALQFCVVVSSINASAQVGTKPHDSTYYKKYPGSIVLRYYMSQKYTAFTMRGKGDIKDLQYRPNTTFNAGIGATYHNFSLNLAYGWGFINSDANEGKTKYLDLQGHVYRTNWVIDYYGQLYKGYYLFPQDFTAPTNGDYYYRKDVKVNLFGLSTYKVLNGNRFSYRAALIQNEWQKKSAGTLLLGAEAYYGIIKADSALVPNALKNNYAQSGIDRLNYFSFGPGAGYAYTLVGWQHLYLTGSITANINVTNTAEHVVDNKQSKWGLNTNTRFRLAAGYNSDTWNVSGSWVSDQLRFTGSSDNKYLLQTGNYRIIVAKRLMPGNRLKKQLKLADKIFKE